jgi:hypothetical protein
MSTSQRSVEQYHITSRINVIGAKLLVVRTHVRELLELGNATMKLIHTSLL